MNIAIITGAAGLIGSEAAAFFSPGFDLVVGIDNDSRADYFGAGASTACVGTNWRSNSRITDTKTWISAIGRRLKRFFGNSAQISVSSSIPRHNPAMTGPPAMRSRISK